MSGFPLPVVCSKLLDSGNGGAVLNQHQHKDVPEAGPLFIAEREKVKNKETETRRGGSRERWRL